MFHKTPRPIRLFSTDLDGTLLGNPEATDRFAQAWYSIDPLRRPLLVYNTGRSVESTRQLVAARDLPEPAYIIGGIGTELHAPQLADADDFSAQFSAGWDLAAVEKIVGANSAAVRQPPDFLHPYKSSWFWPRAPRRELDHLEHCFAAAKLKVTLVYSCQHFLDVLPACADKGKALAWLCKRIGVPLANVLVAGDTGNDSSMFLLPDVNCIVVENALPELFAAIVSRQKFVARTMFADGVLDGLRHFGVFTDEPRVSRAGARLALPSHG